MSEYITGEHQELSVKVDIDMSVEFRLEAALLKIEQLTVKIEDLEKLNESAEMLIEGYRQRHLQLEALKAKADEMAYAIEHGEPGSVIHRLTNEYLEASKELDV